MEEEMQMHRSEHEDVKAKDESEGLLRPCVTKSKHGIHLTYFEEGRTPTNGLIL